MAGNKTGSCPHGPYFLRPNRASSPPAPIKGAGTGQAGICLLALADASSPPSGDTDASTGCPNVVFPIRRNAATNTSSLPLTAGCTTLLTSKPTKVTLVAVSTHSTCSPTFHQSTSPRCGHSLAISPLHPFPSVSFLFSKCHSMSPSPCLIGPQPAIPIP